MMWHKCNGFKRFNIAFYAMTKEIYSFDFGELLLFAWPVWTSKTASSQLYWITSEILSANWMVDPRQSC